MLVSSERYLEESEYGIAMKIKSELRPEISDRAADCTVGLGAQAPFSVFVHRW